MGAALLPLGTDGAVPMSPGSPEVSVSPMSMPVWGSACPGDAGSVSPLQKGHRHLSLPSPPVPLPVLLRGGQSQTSRDKVAMAPRAAGRCHVLPSAACPRRRHPREGKSSKADTEHNVALGCLCSFCSPVTFVNQLINCIRTALLPRLSVIGQGRSGAGRQREPWFGFAGRSGSSECPRWPGKVPGWVTACWGAGDGH